MKNSWQPVDPSYFTGNGRLEITVAEKEIAVATVVFDPGCRNHWHSHPVSQTLIVTDGLGFYQEQGSKAQVLRPGMTVYIGKEVKHWHGATKASSLTHIAITLNDATGANANWFDPVDHETYEAAHLQLSADQNSPVEDLDPAPVVTAGRDQLGQFAPLFAQLNDDVLFGQIWSRTAQLSARDRSLVTLSTLMASGILDSSLEFHLQTARHNGVGKAEIAEILTHAAFYMGWPKAWAAFRLAQKVWNDL